MGASDRRDRLIDLAFVLPILLLVAVLFVYPLLYGVDLSLNRTEGFEVVAPVGLANYARALLGDAVFRLGLMNTLVFTGAAVILQTGVGLILAVLIAETRWGGTLYRVVFMAPFVIAPAAVGVVWSFMYSPFFGVVPSIGAALGVNASTFAPLADPRTALWAIVVVLVWRYAGFVSVIYAAAIRSIPRQYFESAKLEGISWLARLRHITWPLLWPQTFALTLLTTVGTLRIFDLVWMLTGGGPEHATETVATHVFATAFRSLDVGYAQAMATILMGVILALAIVEYRILNPRAEAVAG